MSITIATVRIMLSAFQTSSIAGIVDAVIFSILVIEGLTT